MLGNQKIAQASVNENFLANYYQALYQKSYLQHQITLNQQQQHQQHLDEMYPQQFFESSSLSSIISDGSSESEGSKGTSLSEDGLLPETDINKRDEFLKASQSSIKIL